MNAATVNTVRRIKGRCFYCDARTNNLTCAPCRPLLQLDPLYGPLAWKKDTSGS